MSFFMAVRQPCHPLPCRGGFPVPLLWQWQGLEQTAGLLSQLRPTATGSPLVGLQCGSQRNLFSSTSAQRKCLEENQTLFPCTVLSLCFVLLTCAETCFDQVVSHESQRWKGPSSASCLFTSACGPTYWRDTVFGQVSMAATTVEPLLWESPAAAEPELPILLLLLPAQAHC